LEVHKLFDPPRSVMGPVHVPDNTWVFKIEFSNLHSLQEFVADEVVGGS
jgi:hypothetical protein